MKQKKETTLEQKITLEQRLEDLNLQLKQAEQDYFKIKGAIQCLEQIIEYENNN